MSFNNFRGMLALANKPEKGTSIQDWCPFEGGNSLYEIIDTHNNKCLQRYKSLGWLEEDIEKFGEGITVDNHDLSTFDQLRPKDFERIDIIFLNIDALDLGKKEIEKSFQKLKTRMSRLGKKYFLLQVSREGSTLSRRDKFVPLAIIPSKPEIIPNQAGFESWLKTFSGFYYIALDPAIKSPINVMSSSESDRRGPSIERAIISHERTIPTIASNVRNTALYRGLSKRETIALSRMAAMQEFSLSYLAESVRTSSAHHIVLDSLRQPIENIPFKPLSIEFRLQKTKLIKLSLSKPIHNLTKEQDIALNNLGLKKGSIVIHFSNKYIKDQIKFLGENVQAVNFSAKLPHWPSSNTARITEPLVNVGRIHKN